MRVTRETLIRIARETTQERASREPDIVAAYVTGSLHGDADPMMGGAADIDLVFVHAASPMQSREFVKLTPDFHLDISHRARAEFRSPRELRSDPWLGWEMFAPMLIYEREKFFDFTQAALRGGNDFESAPMVLQRCRKLLSHGRQIWMDLSGAGEEAGPKEVAQYLKSLFHAGNAIAELSGPPIYERRFLLDLPARAQAVERAGMATGILGLLGVPGGMDAGVIAGWLEDWKSTFSAAAETAGSDPRIHSARLNYYGKAIQAILETEAPEAALWPLLSTWTLSVAALPEGWAGPWRAACTPLGLIGARFAEHVEGLDQFLDEVEILLDEVATANGLEAWKTG